MSQVRILHIIDKLSVGGSKIHGPARQIAYRVPCYDPQRYEVLVCSLRHEDPGSEALRAKGINVRCLSRGKFDPRTLTDLFRLVRDWRPSVLHLSGYAAWNFGRVIGWRARVPVVVQEHFVDPRTPPYQRLADWCLRNRQHRAIAVAEAVKEFMILQRHIRKTPIDVIGNGVPSQTVPSDVVDRAGCVRARLRLDSQTRVVGIIGRLAQMKGHAYFLQAAQQVAQRIPQAAFLIVGEGPLGESLQRQAQELGIGQRVRFVGYQPDVLPFLAACDVSVIASIYGEGFCSVGLESYLAGTPVVMTQIACVDGIYEHGKNALVVPPHDPAALADAIVEVLTHPELARALVACGQETLRHCAIEKTATRYLACYEAALQELGQVAEARS